MRVGAEPKRTVCKMLIYIAKIRFFIENNVFKNLFCFVGCIFVVCTDACAGFLSNGLARLTKRKFRRKMYDYSTLCV
jgi:hypothetical protein